MVSNISIRKGDPNLETQTEYPKCMYKEYNDLGTYLASMKHEMMIPTIREWHLGDNLSASPYVDNGQYINTDPFDFKRVSELDLMVAGVSFGESLENLISYISNFKPIHQTKFWDSWSDYIISLLSDLCKAPKIVQDIHVRSKLYHIYNEQFMRLSRRIGLKEFASTIGWSSRHLAAFKTKGNLPVPLEVLSATPLWSLGQLENFMRILNARGETKSRGDWNSMLEQKFQWQKVTEWQEIRVICDDKLDEGEPVYYIEDNAWNYSSSLNLEIENCTMVEEALMIYNFLNNRLKYSLDSKFSLALCMLRNNKYDKAELILRDYIDSINSIIPKDAKLHDSMENYFIAYSLVSYLFARKRDYVYAIKLLHHAQAKMSSTYEWPFHEEIKKLDEEPDQYTKWFKDKNDLLFICRSSSRKA